ncbi:hypothetical protein ABKN59_008412 [Abortiporus biennis]
MIDKLPRDAQPVSSYNLAQLQYLEDNKSLGFDIFHPDLDADYNARRMSSSAASDSSLQSRDDKRPLSPLDSPNFRPTLDAQPAWSSTTNTPSPQPALDEPSDRPEFSPRVQLPSLASAFQDQFFEQRRASLPTLSSESSRLRLPQLHRPSQSASGLASYQFPAENNKPYPSTRPRLETELSLYQDYSLPGTALSATSSSSFSFPPTTDDWASGIVRPSSTPGQLPGALANNNNSSIPPSSLGSLGGPANSHLFGGITRISGHSSDRSNSLRSLIPGIKTESSNSWSFSNSDFPMSASSTNSSALPSANPSISVNSSPTRSPQAQAPSSLVDRPQRKRGKLPKPVTDFLKDWLHRHSDHPYPSEEEKKQLCHATGLSMSQVSNWMINARRRILAPAHRAAAGPTTTTPFSSRSGPSVLDTGRRASMPADSLQLLCASSATVTNSGGRVLTPHDDPPSSRYSFPDHGSSSPQPGSGYATPQ